MKPIEKMKAEAKPFAEVAQQKINELISAHNESIIPGPLRFKPNPTPMGMTYEGIDRLKAYYSMWTGRDPNKIIKEWDQLGDQVLRVPPGIKILSPQSKEKI